MKDERSNIFHRLKLCTFGVELMGSGSRSMASDIVAKSIHLNSDYRISGPGHSPGLYLTPYFHFWIPVTRRQTCTAFVYGTYLIARPPCMVVKNIHLNSDYRISGRGHSPGLYPVSYTHLTLPTIYSV